MCNWDNIYIDLSEVLQGSIHYNFPNVSSLEARWDGIVKNLYLVFGNSSFNLPKQMHCGFLCALQAAEL